jgi:hypothetical protein
MENELSNITIEKPGEGVFIVKFIGSNRIAAEKELKEFIAGRPFTRFIDHFNPNNQIIKILPAQPPASS